MWRGVLVCAVLFVLTSCGPKRVAVNPPEKKAVHVQCGELVIIVGPDTTPSLELAEKLARFLGTEKVCTIETVRLNRKNLRP